MASRGERCACARAAIFDQGPGAVFLLLWPPCSCAGQVCVQGGANLSLFTRLHLKIKTQRLLNGGTIGFAGGWGFVSLEKAGWSGDFEVLA